MKPPKRERRPRIINGILTDGITAYGEKWTLQEKKQLLDGLKWSVLDKMLQKHLLFLWIFQKCCVVKSL